MRGHGHKIRSSLLASLGSWGALFASRSEPPLSRGPHHDPGASLIIRVRLIIRGATLGDRAVLCLESSSPALYSLSGDGAGAVPDYGECCRSRGTVTNLRQNSGVPEAPGTAEARREGQLRGDMETFRIGVPLGRLGEPQDQAHAIVFLASDEASYISGQCIYVDGLQSQC